MTSTHLLATALLLGLTPLALACGGDAKMTGVVAAKLPAGASEGLDHEPCEESGNRVEMLDTNNDGKPDIRRVFDKSSHSMKTGGRALGDVLRPGPIRLKQGSSSSRKRKPKARGQLQAPTSWNKSAS